MSKLTDKTHCVLLKNGDQIWVNAERSGKLKQLLLNAQGTAFVDIDGKLISTSLIAEIMSATDYADFSHTKRGEWKCNFGEWHSKFDKCECRAVPSEENKYLEAPEATQEQKEKLRELKRDILNKFK